MAKTYRILVEQTASTQWVELSEEQFKEHFGDVEDPSSLIGDYVSGNSGIGLLLNEDDWDFAGSDEITDVKVKE